jgi:hypothetical protein
MTLQATTPEGSKMIPSLLGILSSHLPRPAFLSEERATALGILHSNRPSFLRTSWKEVDKYNTLF